MDLLADMPPVSDMKSSIINKRNIYRQHVSISIISFQTRMKVMSSSWFVVYLLIFWN
jgi:hypothetical protein